MRPRADQRSSRFGKLRAARRPPRRSIRLRLTLTYGALFLASGAALLAVTYLLVANFPVTVENRVQIAPGTGSGRRPDELPPLADLAARHREAYLHQLLVRSGIALAIMAFVAIWLGWLIAGRVLRPLRTITAATQRISATNLHARLALPGPDDELKELGDTIDALLARLERSFVSQRQFVANASHELRTPLTLERALLEAALTDPDPTERTWRAACERALAAGAQQERLIEALLILARSEGGLDRHEPFDLATIAGEVLGARHVDVERLGIRLTTTLDPAPAAGDPRLVERLVANLVDNALRYNARAGRLDVRTGTDGGRCVLSVGNTGPVVPAGEVARLFQPFQRLGEGRGRRDGGLGLGLSIVDAIATAHGGRVRAIARPGGGLDVDVSLPAAGPLTAGRVHRDGAPDAGAGLDDRAEAGGGLVRHPAVVPEA